MKRNTFFQILSMLLLVSCSNSSTQTPPLPSATKINLPAQWTSTSVVSLPTRIQPTATWTPMSFPSLRSTRLPFITMTPSIKVTVTPLPDPSSTPSPELPTPTDPACGEVLANAARSGQKILFDSDREGNREIYIMKLDGSGLTNLTQHPAEDWEHQWSPSGDKISFLSDRDGDPHLFIMNRDGSNPTRITNIPTENGYKWSPTGWKIAFTHGRDNQRDIYVVNADGSGLLNLTKNPTNSRDFTWSHDGRRIAFVSYRDGDSEIYVLNTDGSGLNQLTNNNGGDEKPVWSPVSDLIVYASNVKPDEVDPSTDLPKDQYLYAVSSDGKKSTFLSSDPLLKFSYNPAWSRNGKKIIFADIEPGPGFPSHPFMINVDGTGLVRIPEVSTGGRMYFWWSPDMYRIVVWYDNSGSASFSGSTIMVFNADGTNPIKLESNSIFVAWPKWTRDSRFIVYESGSDEMDHDMGQYPLGYGINIIQADGTCFTRLTITTANDNNPLLSPP